MSTYYTNSLDVFIQATRREKATATTFFGQGPRNFDVARKKKPRKGVVMQFIIFY